MDNEQIYNSVENEIRLSEIANGNQEVSASTAAAKYLEFCDNAKLIAPLVIGGSILIGIILLRIFKKDGKIRKTALFVNIIGIPLCVLFFVYVLCFLYGMLF